MRTSEVVDSFASESIISQYNQDGCSHGRVCRQKIRDVIELKQEANEHSLQTSTTIHTSQIGARTLHQKSTDEKRDPKVNQHALAIHELLTSSDKVRSRK